MNANMLHARIIPSPNPPTFWRNPTMKAANPPITQLYTTVKISNFLNGGCFSIAAHGTGWPEVLTSSPTSTSGTRRIKYKLKVAAQALKKNKSENRHDFPLLQSTIVERAIASSPPNCIYV